MRQPLRALLSLCLSLSIASAFQENPYNSTGPFATFEFAINPLTAPVGAVVYAPNVSSIKQQCFHHVDVDDHKCFEACADSKFSTKGILVSGHCPGIYNTVDKVATVLQCPDGVTNTRYCATSALNVTIVTKGEGAQSALSSVLMDSTHSFPVVWFVGGYDGFVPGWGYSQMLQIIASHGFIAIAITDIRCTDMVSPVPFLTSKRAWEHITWLRGNLGSLFQDFNVTAVADWSKLVLMCHSGGCEITTGMNLYLNATTASAIAANINLGPYFNGYAGYDKLLANRTTPTLAFATILAEYGWPPCSFAQYDYAALYSQWPDKAPKMQFAVPERGHCDIYDDDHWYRCSPYVSNWCATNISCSFRLYDEQHCNTTNNGGAKQYQNQSSTCNATVAAEKPCWARYNASDVWSWTMNYAYSQQASQAAAACYNTTDVCDEWGEHIQLRPRYEYRRFSAGVIIAFMSRFALGEAVAEQWLTSSFPVGLWDVKRNF